MATPAAATRAPTMARARRSRPPLPLLFLLLMTVDDDFAVAEPVLTWNTVNR